MAKSLLSKTSKPKKPKSQTKKAVKNTEYTYEVGDIVVYLGSVIESEHKQECKIVGRSRTHIQCSYKIEFSSGEILECIPDVLIFVSDFEDQLAEAEEHKDDTGEMSEEEMKVIANGYEPYRNKYSCYNQIAYYERRCESCTNHVNQCIYVNKYKYKKLDNN